jgi:hypothetical protein
VAGSAEWTQFDPTPTIKMKKKMPVVLYGCETWSLTLREQYGLRSTKENIWTEEERNNRRLEKTAL